MFLNSRMDISLRYEELSVTVVLDGCGIIHITDDITDSDAGRGLVVFRACRLRIDAIVFLSAPSAMRVIYQPPNAFKSSLMHELLVAVYHTLSYHHVTSGHLSISPSISR